MTATATRVICPGCSNPVDDEDDLAAPAAGCDLVVCDVCRCIHEGDCGACAATIRDAEDVR